MVQATTFPKTYLKNDWILIVEQKLRGKMDFRSPIKRKIQGGVWCHYNIFFLAKGGKLGFRGKKRTQR